MNSFLRHPVHTHLLSSLVRRRTMSTSTRSACSLCGSPILAPFNGKWVSSPIASPLTSLGLFSSPVISRSKTRVAASKLRGDEAEIERLYSTHDIIEDPELLQAFTLDTEDGIIVRGSSHNNKIATEKDLIDHEIDEFSELVIEAQPGLESMPDIETVLEPDSYLTFEPLAINLAEENRRIYLSKSLKRDKRQLNRGLQTATKKLKKEEREKVAKVKRSELERAGKDVSFNKSLVSYLELCVFTGQLNKALSSLNYYRTRGKTAKQLPTVTSIAAFNCLLHGYAAKGNSAVAREVFQLILNDNLKPTPQSYAALLESFGRAHDQTNSSQQKDSIVKHIDDTISSLKTSGFTTKDLFNYTVFAGNQREVVLAAIHLRDPSFEPVIDPPFPHYVCPLLAHLNDPEPNYSIQSPAASLITQRKLEEMAKRQLKTELHGSITVKSIEIKENKDALGHYRSILEETEKQWTKAVDEAFKRNMNALINQTLRQKNHKVISLYPFLKVLSPADCVKIILQEIRKLAEGSETYSPSIAQLHRELGLRVLSRYEVMYKKQNGILDKVDALYQKYSKWYLNPAELGAHQNPRQKWQELLFDPTSTGPHVDIGEKVWPNSVLCSIGRFLYGIVMRDIKINAHVMKANVLVKPEQLVPAFYSIFRMQGVHLKEEIKPHPILVKLFQAASRDELTFDSSLVPMVCPPLPWASIRTGGYLLSAAKIVRLPYQAHQQRHRLEKCPPEDLYPSLDSLNQLGCVPWKINESVLDILIQVFNNKGDESLAVPPPPSECPSAPPIEPTMEKQEKFQIHKQRLALKRKKAEMYSLWCDALYRLSIANHFRKDIFWFPHNMDFRGRVYPCPPHLNHLGADTARAILVFALGQPLGPKGLDWLKIHLINLTGLKKRDPLRDRLKFANEMLNDILDSADNPLTGRRWWTEADEPWQALACCIEISKAIRSGDPRSYICHFPIQQDGSCNGLQHYAALGRDQAGAESVNLSPCYTPQDVYSSVGALVEKLRIRDAANGVQIAQVLEGFIKRKVIKQTVMTTVYGVTRYGARLQIAKQLKDIPNFPKEHLWPASLYLVGRTFDSLQEMFTSTKEIQDWFTECARMISHVCGQNVEWVTPLGLPIVQPYFRQSKKTFDAHDPLRIKETSSFDMFERPNVMKQKNAFPPNFIHSLDSSHMMLTSLHCERASITYVSVHDCYWTHPKTVEIMNKICREQFVSLHSQPILEDLSNFLVKKYSYRDSDMMRDGSLVDMSKNELNRTLRAVPEKGSFDLKSVLQSIYFFS